MTKKLHDFWEIMSDFEKVFLEHNTKFNRVEIGGVVFRIDNGQVFIELDDDNMPPIEAYGSCEFNFFGRKVRQEISIDCNENSSSPHKEG